MRLSRLDLAALVRQRLLRLDRLAQDTFKQLTFKCILTS